MTLKTTHGPKNLRHTGLGPYVGARMVGPVCRTPIELTQLAEYISQILLKYYIPAIEMLVK
jgi:hypothetical protein